MGGDAGTIVGVVPRTRGKALSADDRRHRGNSIGCLSLPTRKPLPGQHARVRVYACSGGASLLAAYRSGPMRWHYFRRVGSHSRAAVRPTERVVRLRQPPRWQLPRSAGRQWSPTRRLIYFISFGRAAGYEPSNIAPGPRWADFRSFAAVVDQRRGSPWVTSRNIFAASKSHRLCFRKETRTSRAKLVAMGQ